MHQKRRGRFFPKDGIQLPACCASAAWTARPSGGRRPVSVACQGRPLKNGPSGAGLSGAGSTAGVPEGAVAAVAAEDGGCGVRFLSPRLLRAYLPLSVLRILAEAGGGRGWVRPRWGRRKCVGASSAAGARPGARSERAVADVGRYLLGGLPGGALALSRASGERGAALLPRASGGKDLVLVGTPWLARGRS